MHEKLGNSYYWWLCTLIMKVLNSEYASCEIKFLKLRFFNNDLWRRGWDYVVDFDTLLFRRVFKETRADCIESLMRFSESGKTDLKMHLQKSWKKLPLITECFVRRDIVKLNVWNFFPCSNIYYISIRVVFSFASLECTVLKSFDNVPCKYM